MIQHCVLFDMDGTLYDSGIDFLALRAKLGLPQDGRPILAQLQAASPGERAHGIELLHAAEAEGAAGGRVIPGTAELLSWLNAQGILTGLVTNNTRRSVDVMLDQHPLSFDVILTRDDAATKPAPDLFLLALDKLGCAPSAAAAVGDTHLDAVAAHRAGIREIYLVALPDWMADVIPTEVVYTSAANLADVLVEMKTWRANPI